MNDNKNYSRTATLNADPTVSWIKDFALLVKLRLNITVVFSAVMAYLIAAGDKASLVAVVFLGVGGFCVTAAANALNEVLERDFDKLMKRTQNRPLAAGRMTVGTAVLIAGLMSVLGITLLAMFNPWAALLGTIALITYAFIYTPMKRSSALAVLVGAIPGALPVMIGCVAFEGSITALALMLFMIQFIWQFPHFWSIAWLGDEDYKKAGFSLLPSISGKKDSSVGMLSFVMTALFLPTFGIMYMVGMISLLTFVLAIILSIGYAFFAWKLYKKCDRKSAMQLMFWSFGYIPVVFVLIYLIG